MNSELKAYQIQDPETGRIRSRFYYFAGHPVIIRFNGQTGRFSQDGKLDLGTSLTLIPLAWKIFEGDVFGRSGSFLELFYVDRQRSVCCVMFTNTSVAIFQKFCAQLISQGQDLSRTEITITPSVRKNKQINSSYHVAEFSGQPANPRAVQMLAEFACDFPIYRLETWYSHGGHTITDLARSFSYYNYDRCLLEKADATSQKLYLNQCTDPFTERAA